MLQLFNRKYNRIIQKIELLQKDFQKLNDNELLDKNLELKQKYKEKKNLNDLISESFALTQEAIFRCFNYKPYKNQIIGGLALNDRKVIEMKTGEGKSLTAILPACLQALTEKGVYIMTTNDYLARRDKEKMEKIFLRLGFTVGLIQANMSREEKKINYNKDIIYTTNSTVIFDYLIDNMVLDKENVILRPFYSCIIDEVDSILIDEAKIPLIMAENIESKEFKEFKYLLASKLINILEEDKHFFLNRRNNSVTLTNKGEDIIKQSLDIITIYDPENPWISIIKNAIRAKYFFIKDVDYIINENKILIIDQYTGRIESGRKWNGEIQHALEAKESLKISENRRVQSSITYQTFFLQYSRISGMTGTGKEVEAEFKKIYNLEVKKIPLNKKNQRKDLFDQLFLTKKLKISNIILKCKEISLTNQPILIVTRSLKDSELLAFLLEQENLKYQILNAKVRDHLIESDIISKAGRAKQITIATTMAGRGTDIILGGNLEYDNQRFLYNLFIKLKKQKNSYEEILSLLLKFSKKFKSIFKQLVTNTSLLKLQDTEIWDLLQKKIIDSKFIGIEFLIEELLERNIKEYKSNRQIVINSGGLFVLGAEKNRSLRVDNQIRGRCARQGDPGTSQFFLSLEDDFFTLFGDVAFQKKLKNKIKDSTAIKSRFMQRQLTKIQNLMEQEDYRSRKINFEYDKVLNELRNIIYLERSRILEDKNLENIIIDYTISFLTNLINYLEKKNSKENVEILFKKFLVKKIFKNKKKKYIIKNVTRALLSKKESHSLNLLTRTFDFKLLRKKDNRKYIRIFLLRELNFFWLSLLNKDYVLREVVPLRSYNYRIPAVEYRREMINLFYLQKKKLQRKNFYNFLNSFAILD
uniref:Protein translocase subunit SecA n=1 Tax=Nitzschia sp. NIES-3576 TaxID=2083273 RepID=A0A2Z5ZBK7_9STRA|nr:preprotein translocase subunit A [Nitzschia sp. NIES-3576]